MNTITMANNPIHVGSIVSLQPPSKIYDAYGHARIIAKTDRYWIAKLVCRSTKIHAVTETHFISIQNPGLISNIIVNLWLWPEIRPGEQVLTREEMPGSLGVVHIPPESREILEAQCGEVDTWDMYWQPWDEQLCVTEFDCK